MSDQAYLQYEHESGVTARWHGGEYIELGYVAEVDTGPFNNHGQPSYEKGEFVAGDVINVWDHAEGKARIPFSIDALTETVDSRLADEDEED